MKKYTVYVLLSLVLIIALELYRRLSSEPISTYLVVGYINTIGIAFITSTNSKIIMLEEKMLKVENTLLKGFLDINKELGKLEHRIETMEKHDKTNK